MNEASTLLLPEAKPDEEKPMARPNFPIVIKTNRYKPPTGGQPAEPEKPKPEVVQSSDQDLTGMIVEVLPAGTSEVLSSKETEEDGEESSAESEGSGVFGMPDMTFELAACEEQMS